MPVSKFRRCLQAAFLLGVISAAGCTSNEQSLDTYHMNPDVEQSCVAEGFDRGTTEFANCVEELSESDQ
jgi:hypothetical protein